MAGFLDSQLESALIILWTLPSGCWSPDRDVTALDYRLHVWSAGMEVARFEPCHSCCGEGGCAAVMDGTAGFLVPMGDRRCRGQEYGVPKIQMPTLLNADTIFR